MKSLLFIVLSLTSTLGFAKADLAGVLEFKIAQAQYSSEHVQNAGEATLKLDYNQKQVSLKIERRFFCPEGRACAMVMPVPLIVELPIVSVKADNCGILTVVAKKDSRPADGSLEVITVTDPSRMTCKTFVAHTQCDTEGGTGSHGFGHGRFAHKEAVTQTLSNRVIAATITPYV